MIINNTFAYVSSSSFLPTRLPLCEITSDVQMNCVLYLIRFVMLVFIFFKLYITGIKNKISINVCMYISDRVYAISFVWHSTCVLYTSGHLSGKYWCSYYYSSFFRSKVDAESEREYWILIFRCAQVLSQSLWKSMSHSSMFNRNRKYCRSLEVDALPTLNAISKNTHQEFGAWQKGQGRRPGACRHFEGLFWHDSLV